jgi:SpoVK/Ycf46/Vps4 family AAA+-type ATPase
MEDIGGLENLKSWLMRRKKAFSREAREFGLRPPKGILMVGAPGTGKSLTAKATAKLFGMPLLKLDMSKVFGSLVGESEKNMAEALKIAESIAPCILFVDEIEKAFAGISSSGETDSGVTARVIGQLLTWMQERQKPVFVVATCNDPFKLPPEMTRAGRFDDIFHVDLPSRSEREEIFRIHLNKIGRDPGNFDISEFARLTEGYSGAEIEQIITEALYRAFDEGLELDNQHIIEEIQGYMPLSKKRKDEIERIRKWAEIYCKPASIRDSESGSKARRIEL